MLKILLMSIVAEMRTSMLLLVLEVGHDPEAEVQIKVGGDFRKIEVAKEQQKAPEQEQKHTRPLHHHRWQYWRWQYRHQDAMQFAYFSTWEGTHPVPISFVHL